MVSGDVKTVFAVKSSFDANLVAPRLLDAVPDAIIVVGEDLSISYLNATARAVMAGTSSGSENLVGANGFDVVHPDDQPNILENLAELLAHPGSSRPVEFRVRHFDEPDGWKPVEATATNLMHDPDIAGIVVSFRDLVREHEIATAAMRLGTALERTSDLMFLRDRSGVLVYANAAAREFLSSHPNANSDRWPYDPVIADLFDQVVVPIAREKGLWSGEFMLPSANGERTLSAVITLDDDGYSVVTARDVTERKRFEADLQYRATHDSLTGLPNRPALMTRLCRDLETTRFPNLSVLFIDLDRFKLVNDSMGHHFGDEFLNAITRRFAKQVAGNDFLARLGGDEFVLVIDDNEGRPDAAADAAERLHASLRSPIVLAGTPIFASASIGIASQDGSTAPEDLLRCADLAMFRAKQTGRARTAWFAPNMAIEAERGLTIESQLHLALEAGDIVVAYQPVVSLPSARVVGFEALVRWNKGGELIEPGAFLSIAEQSDLITTIDTLVLNTACRQLAEWTKHIPGGEALHMAVNLSARQLARVDLAATIGLALTDSGIAPERLVLEITESDLMTDLRATVAALEDVRELGVRLAIDDFGTGYSSLSYLQMFRAHTVKIDRSFIEKTDQDEPDSRIVEAIVGLAQTFGMTTVAEGVETTAQFDRIQELGCSAAQGYLLGRAVLEKRATELLLQSLLEDPGTKKPPRGVAKKAASCCVTPRR